VDQDSHPYRLSALLWPLFAQQLLGLLIGNLQVLLLAHLTESAVGAVGVANQLLGTLSLLFTVVALGTAILMSRLLGARRPGQARQVARVSLSVSLGLGLVFSVAFVFGGTAVPTLMALPPAMAADAAVYSQIVGAASVVQALTSSLSAAARSWGDTRLPLVAAAVTGLVTLGGTALVVLGPPELRAAGIAGVGAATVAGQLLGLAVTLVPLVRRHPDLFRAPGRRWFQRSALGDILRMGGPAAAESVSYSLAQVVVTGFSVTFGPAAIEARIVLLNLTGFISLFSYSVGQATQIAAGYWKGAGEPDRLLGSSFRSLRLALTVNALLSLGLLGFGTALVRLFTTDPQVVELARTILLIDLALEVGRALNHVMGSALRGTGDVRYPAAVSVLSMWLLAVLAGWWLGAGVQMGLAGLWAAAALDEWGRGLLLLRRWRSRRWLTA